MKSIIVVGGGGHAKVIIAVIESGKKYSIEGIVDPGLPLGSQILGYRVIGNDDTLVSMKRSNQLLALGVGSVRADDKRKNVFYKFLKLGYQFPAIIHPATTLHKTTIFGEGTQIMAGVLIQPDVGIGDNTIVNSKTLIEHDCRIASHCHIAPGAILGGGVMIGEGSFIGLGARVIPGVTIGSGVTVGAGAVVIRNVADSKTVMGVPAREMEAARV